MVSHVEDTTIIKQLTDPKAALKLSDMTQEDMHQYYLVLERRVVGSNVAMFEVNHRSAWVPGLPEDDMAFAFEAVHARWMDVVRALDFADAHALATTANSRREKIRQEVRQKLAEKDASANSTGEGEVESEQRQARTTSDAVDSRSGVSAASS